MTRSKKQKSEQHKTEQQNAEARIEDQPAARDAAEPIEQAVAAEDAAPQAMETDRGESAEEAPSPLEELSRQRDEFQEKWLRAVAEVDNIRKRSRRDVEDARRLAQMNLLRPLLDVRDNFERALQSLGDTGENVEAGKVIEGIELIFQSFLNVLQERGVRPIEAVGKPFDPAFHEAVGQFPREGAEPGEVIEVVQPGFMFEDVVLRAARVIVAA